MANFDDVVAFECANAVGNQTIRRPIASADYIAGTRTCDMSCVGAVKRCSAIPSEDHLSGGLRLTVRIDSAQLISFYISMLLFFVLIALV